MKQQYFSEDLHLRILGGKEFNYKSDYYQIIIQSVETDMLNVVHLNKVITNNWLDSLEHSSSDLFVIDVLFYCFCVISQILINPFHVALFPKWICTWNASNTQLTAKDDYDIGNECFFIFLCIYSLSRNIQKGTYFTDNSCNHIVSCFSEVLGKKGSSIHFS